MLNEEREVKWQDAETGKMTEPQAFDADTPESYAEAVETLGESGAFSIFLAGLKVKQDNVARNAFKAGKEKEEVEAAVAAWRPGGQRVSKKNSAITLMMSKNAEIAADPDLQKKIQSAFMSNDFDAILTLLEPQEV